MMRIFHTTFNQKNLTGNAGLSLLGRFAKKLNLHKLLDQHISIERGENATYQVSDAVLMLVFGVLAGAKHISHLALLRSDKPFRKLFKWKQFPDASTFGRIFKLFTFKHCKELAEVEDIVRRKVWSKKYFGKVTLELDSTVRPVFGSQEGAAKGYNPKKKSQKAYHPLLCFIAETRECLHNWFRSGDAYSANGCVDFIKECFARLPKRVWSIDVRADSAFFNGDLLDFLEEKGARYTIKVKLKGLENLLRAKNGEKSKTVLSKAPNSNTSAATGKRPDVLWRCVKS